jgi:hypothetical protein
VSEHQPASKLNEHAPYERGILASFSWKTPPVYATTGALPAVTATELTLESVGNEALEVDGAHPAVGMQILVKNQVLKQNNGLFMVVQAGGVAEHFLLVRAIDGNTTEALQDAAVFIQKGATNEGHQFVQTATVTTVGTTAQEWVEFHIGVVYTAKTPLKLVGAEFEIPNGSLTTAQIKAEGIETASIKLLAITTGLLAEGAVTAIKLGAESVETGKIKLLAITNALIANETIETAQIKKEGVAANRLKPGEIETTQVKEKGLNANRLKNEEIQAEQIKPLAITTGTLAEKAVTAIKVTLPTKPAAGAENTVVVGVAGVPRQIVAVIKGNAVATAFKIKHSLETQIAAVNILSATFEEPVTMLAKSVAISLSEIEVTFTVAPGAGVVNYVVITG